MMIRSAVLASVFVAGWAVGYVAVDTALAQQQPAPNPQEQIERTLGSLFIANTNLTAQLQAAQARVTSLNDEVVKAQARIKELETKQEAR